MRANQGVQRAGKRLLQRRLQVDGEARYLRVLAQGDARLPTLRSVLAELPPAPATLPWEWLSLEPTSKRKGEYTFEMDGRFPAARADVASTDNSLVQGHCSVAMTRARNGSAVVHRGLPISCSRARRASVSNRLRSRWAVCIGIVTGSW